MSELDQLRSFTVESVERLTDAGVIYQAAPSGDAKKLEILKSEIKNLQVKGSDQSSIAIETVDSTPTNNSWLSCWQERQRKILWRKKDAGMTT